MTRRLITRILLPLALGLLTTIIIALSFAAWVPWNNPDIASSIFAPRGSDESSVSILQLRQPGALYRHIQTLDTENPRSPRLPETAKPIEILPENQVDRSWGFARRALIDATPEIDATEEARGWPFLCLYTWQDLATKTSGGDLIRIGRADDPWRDNPVTLPTRPIYRGLMLNTLIYATLWLLLLPLPGRIRRHLRLRRGHCPSCNYDLRASATNICSECGWTTKPAPATRAVPPV